MKEDGVNTCWTNFFVRVKTDFFDFGGVEVVVGDMNFGVKS